MRETSPGWRGAGLGVAQLVAWGALYYPPTVLGASIGADLGVPSATIYGAFTYALVVAALVSPWMSRAVAARGGWAVLAFGTTLGAAGLVVIAASRDAPLAIVGVTAVGGALGLCLYDALFASLATLDVLAFRKTVNGVVLVGGLASTVSWPLVAALEVEVGWRGALLVLAALLVTIPLPLYAWLLPAHERAAAPVTRAPVRAGIDRRTVLLAVAFAGASFVTSAIGAHVVDLLGGELPRETAIALASLLGPMQVLGRVLDRVAQGRLSARATALVALGGLVASLSMLAGIARAAWLPLGFAVVYGAANGVLTVARAGVPAELTADAGARAVLLGRLAAASLAARAAAPLAFAALTGAGASGLAIGATFAVASTALVAYVAALRSPEAAPIESMTGGTR